jgi:hypothetical protein
MIEQEETDENNRSERNKQDDAAKSGAHSATTTTALTAPVGHESAAQIKFALPAPIIPQGRTLVGREFIRADVSKKIRPL